MLINLDYEILNSSGEFVNFLGIDKKKIYVYPSPENNHKILYRDNAKNCFQFYQQEVPCPSDKSKISSFPIQSIPSS